MLCLLYTSITTTGFILNVVAAGMFVYAGIYGGQDVYKRQGYTGENRNFPAVYRNLQDNQIVQVGVKIPILDWGKRRGKVRVAKSNRDVVLSKIRQEQINFNQDIFLLVEHFNNQAQQLDIAKEADAIAQQRYKTVSYTHLSAAIPAWRVTRTNIVDAINER